MIETLDDFYAKARPYTDMFDAFVTKHTFVGKGKCDHVCYRCASSESFERIRGIFETEGFMYQAQIAGRRIAILKFRKPLQTLLGDITLLELSDQKPDHSQKEGFEHIEVYPIGWSYEDMISYFTPREIVRSIDRPHHPTHDIEIREGFLWRCTRGPLLEKIKSEMV